MASQVAPAAENVLGSNPTTQMRLFDLRPLTYEVLLMPGSQCFRAQAWILPFKDAIRRKPTVFSRTIHLSSPNGICCF